MRRPRVRTRGRPSAKCRTAGHPPEAASKSAVTTQQGSAKSDRMSVRRSHVHGSKMGETRQRRYVRDSARQQRYDLAAHLLDVLGIHRRHLEHAHRVGGQDLLQLRVRRDGAALVELVLLNVGPDGLRDLRAGHLVLAADRGEVGGQRLDGEEPDTLLLLRRRDLLTDRLRRLALVLALRPLAARVLDDLLLLLFLLFLLLGLLLLLLLGLLLLRLLRLLLGRLLRRLLRLLLLPC